MCATCGETRNYNGSGFRPPEPAQVPSEGTGSHIPGGRNVIADQYVHSDGYPPLPGRTRFIGTLAGDWREMGRQFGERSGDAARCVSDVWWKDQCDKWGRAETLKAMDLYQDQVRALDPDLVDFMAGIADGASPWLDQSEFARGDSPLHGSNYHRVLAANIHDEWNMHHPMQFPDGSSTHGGAEATKLPPGVSMCSGFSARGQATLAGETIAAENRQCNYDPRCYQQAYTTQPNDGNACWVLTNCPQVAANQIVNDKGVSLALFSGGRTNPRSLDHRGEAYYAEGFGVPWFHLFLHVCTHANSADEAIEMLTLGTQGYRERTGRTTLYRGGGWIFLVTDPETMAVVEVTADRYAIRRPGEFTGSDWTDVDHIVATNHNLCDFSYDRGGNRTDIPMTLFGDGYERDPASGDVTGLDGSGSRFWTLMWDIRHNYGQLDRYRAQRIMSGLNANDPGTGERTGCARDDLDAWEGTRPCNQGRVSLKGGTADAKIAVLDGGGSAVYWTLGSPSHWEGAWDEFRFRKRSTSSGELIPA